MRIDQQEWDQLQQLARGRTDPLPLHADRVPGGWDVHASWAQTTVADWRARHDPLCACWRPPRTPNGSRPR